MTFLTLALLAASPQAPSLAPDAALHPLTTPPRYAGIYHVSTGTWTRAPGGAAAIGPDVVYSNTAPTGYFTSLGGAGGFAPGSENFDEGSIPGLSNPEPFATAPNRNEYSVNCVQVAYCDLGPAASSGWVIRFYNEYNPCTLDTSPDGVVLVTGLPANAACWIVDLDLTGGNEVCLTADGDGTWANSTMLDSFGWSYTYAGSAGGAGQNAGFVLTGDPASTDPSWVAGGLPTDGVGTYYGNPGCAGATGGTGYKTQDFWWLEDPATTNSGCYWFGGYGNGGPCDAPGTNRIYSSFWMELGADTGPCSDCFCTAYCTSNPNSTGVNGQIELQGSHVALDDDVTLVATNLPTFSFGFFIVSEDPGFVANPAGSQGNLCLGGDIGRFVGPGQIQNSGMLGEIRLSTAAGQWSLTQVPTPMGPRASMTGTSDHFQLWHRDNVGGATSNFTDAVFTIWQ